VTNVLNVNAPELDGQDATALLASLLANATPTTRAELAANPFILDVTGTVLPEPPPKA
jgi:hypothetical protein